MSGGFSVAPFLPSIKKLCTEVFPLYSPIGHNMQSMHLTEMLQPATFTPARQALSNTNRNTMQSKTKNKHLAKLLSMWFTKAPHFLHKPWLAF